MSDPEWEAELAKIDARVAKEKADAAARQRALLDCARAVRDARDDGRTFAGEYPTEPEVRMLAALDVFLAAGGTLDEETQT